MRMLQKDVCLGAVLLLLFVYGLGNAADSTGMSTPRFQSNTDLSIPGLGLLLGEGEKEPHPSDLATNVPFSFTYGGQSSRALLAQWEIQSTHRKTDSNRTTHHIVWTDLKTGLRVRWEAVEYHDFDAVEWTLYFENTSQRDSPILSNIYALDVKFTRKSDQEFLLRHWKGTRTAIDDYQPLTTVLGSKASERLAPVDGRPCSGVWPYYNLQTSNEGIMTAIGWPGQWAATFTRDDGKTLHVQAGQEVTHFKLLAGETVRTPMIAMLFWKNGDWIDAQNLWRKWMIKHNVPHPGGKPLPLPMFNACSSHQFAEMTKADEQSQKDFIDSYLKKGLELDYWWMDAGWYVGAAEKGWPWTGTWEVDRRAHRFPHGLRAISDYAHSKGVKIIVWFEPERVAEGTWLATEHPGWILGGSKGGLLNLGDPQAWNWVVNHIDKIITDEGIDLYRQDYNIGPLNYWRQNDAEDHQGITEIKYVMGYLAYWDELLRRHPGMLIDSCASGGNRNDLETMRRAVPLLRSDYLFEPVGQQDHTYALSFWLPFYGTGYCPSNAGGWGWGTGGLSYAPYIRRSNMCPSNTGCFDFRVKVDDELILKLYREWREIGPDYFGDYYPLTDYSLSEGVWMAWQFNRPENGEGFVQAFRRQKSVYSAAQLKLRGLDPEVTYVLKNYDVSGTTSSSGRDLMEKGLAITIPKPPGAVTIKYSIKK
jgi:alpha-galactosidase